MATSINRQNGLHVTTAQHVERRSRFLPFALPDLDETELVEVAETLRSGWITTGPKTRKFETKFAQLVNVKHAIAVNSCTAAMHLAMDAIGLQPGDEIITTPYTFAATAAVIRYFNAHPKFVDVDPDSLNIDAKQLESAISNRTKAILPVHIAGLPADLKRIHEVARQHGLPVIEDAAHAFGSSYKGKQIGGLSDFTCFSFYATKAISTGEGGMLCTNDDVFADRCRLMSLHGISRDAWKRYTSEGNWYYEVLNPGFKYNMSDISAALGLAQLRKAGQMQRRRRQIAHAYTQAFRGIAELCTPVDCFDSGHSWHLYMLRLNLPLLSIDRGTFIEELKRRHIGSSVHFIPLHAHPYYRDAYGYQTTSFPIAFREAQREISLPIYSRMADEDVRDVITAVIDVVDSFRIR